MKKKLAPVWDGCFWSQPITIPIQNHAVLLRIITDGAHVPPSARQIDVASRVWKHLNGMSDLLDGHAEASCRDHDDRVSLLAEDIHIDYGRIGDHYRVLSVLIGALDQCAEDYFFLTCDCDWEKEHGIQFMLAGREVLYCGEDTGAAHIAETDDEYREFSQ